MGRIYNFSAGPAVLPEEVLREAAEEMLDYKGSGMSVMEMSHRSKTYDSIIKEAEADLRELMNIPSNYKVLFLQGGASLQFAAIPMNLMKNGIADYIVTGEWAKKAYQEACMYGKANKIASSEDKTFSYIPDCSDLPISEQADYVYICENNTIYGTKFKTLPNTKIIINSILPVSEKAVSKTQAYSYQELFNTKLKELAEELGIPFLENSIYLKEKENPFSQDGVHPKGFYYSLWAKNMAEYLKKY